MQIGRFVEVDDRHQASFLPACLEDDVDADNPVRIINAFLDELDLAKLGFDRVQPVATGRPGYALRTMPKLYVHGSLHPLTSSWKLEHDVGRNIALMWLTGRLMPDFRTVAGFRRHNASSIQIVCQRFVAICFTLGEAPSERCHQIAEHADRYDQTIIAESYKHPHIPLCVDSSGEGLSSFIQQPSLVAIYSSKPVADGRLQPDVIA